MITSQLEKEAEVLLNEAKKTDNPAWAVAAGLMFVAARVPSVGLDVELRGVLELSGDLGISPDANDKLQVEIHGGEDVAANLTL